MSEQNVPSSPPPSRMHAITVGDPPSNSLQWQEVDTPTISAGDVLVRTRATAVNRADLLQRRGKYPPPAGASPILGLEMAGEITALGAEVDGWAIGDRVCALLAGGGYAEYVSCPASQLLPIPQGIGFEQAAALPEAVYTSYLALCVDGRMTAGDTVLIHAAASGIGTMALQVCRALGATAYATASANKLERLTDLGAAATIDRQGQDFVERVQTLTNRRGVDIVLDCVGASYLERNLAALARGGRLVLIGLLGGSRAEVPLNQLLMRRLSIVGTVLRSRSATEKAELTDAIRAQLWPQVTKGGLKPIIDRVLPITAVEEAHELIRTNQTTGKIVLSVAS